MNSRPLHIAWDNSLVGRNRTGSGVYAVELLKEFSCNPQLIVEKFEGLTLGKTASGPIARQLRALGYLWWSHVSFPRILRRGKFDLVHGPAFFIPLDAPCPAVVTVHDLTFRRFPHHFDPRWQKYISSLMPSVLRVASAVICVSEHTRCDLISHYKVSPQKIHAVYPGIDKERYNPEAQIDRDWARSAGITRDFVLHVGMLSERKNIPLLLRAVARLKESGRFSGYQLVLAGTESPGMTGAAEIHRTIRELELNQQVVLTGRVPDEKLPGLYRAASVTVMPSLYEGFGFPVLESMAVGTPVIASKISSLPELAGDAALLVSPDEEAGLAEAITGILENHSLASELRRKGLERARQFSWRRTAAETLAVYRTVTT